MKVIGHWSSVPLGFKFIERFPRRLASTLVGTEGIDMCVLCTSASEKHRLRLSECGAFCLKVPPRFGEWEVEVS